MLSFIQYIAVLSQVMSTILMLVFLWMLCSVLPHQMYASNEVRQGLYHHTHTVKHSLNKS